ncbi:MAG TPA: hypothetical protein DDZ80_11095 [Cyanobacteria bacterium UBA8803]|nr:hypothetical protein [Cyanobacteria bacterium UBA9273]HBL59037.1 hypothetical protein [Cyanobacteria bacterium UBA8803]
MFGLGLGGDNLLDLEWQGTLSDYVTAVAWSPTGDRLAASSAAGEVMLWMPDRLTMLQAPTGESTDTLAFSPQGQFLAAGGQDGRVKIWQLPQQGEGNRGGDRLQNTLLSPHSNVWIEHLAWSPLSNQLAYSVGRCVQIWDADKGEMQATLNFAASSVLGIHWRPDGKYLAVCGHRGVKVWNAQNWQDEPYLLDIRAASLAIAWSTDGQYLASGNLDRTLMVMEWHHPDPWLMRGFPGKIRTVTWSEPKTDVGVPLLTSASANSITVWKKQADESAGWEAIVLDLHEGTVQAIAFQPGTFLLASAADDGYVCLWQEAQQVAQILEGAPNGFSRLAWHPQGQKLAAGGQNGELIIWSESG